MKIHKDKDKIKNNNNHNHNHKDIVIRKSIQSDILPIAVNMRDDDVKEIWDSNLHSPYMALYKGITRRGSSWTILVNNVPVCIVGVSHISFISDKGRPWLLGTNAMVEDKKLFHRTSKIILEKISEGYKVLENYVSVQNKVSLKWLERLGFTIAEDINSITGVTFKRFYKEIE